MIYHRHSCTYTLTYEHSLIRYNNHIRIRSNTHTLIHSRTRLFSYILYIHTYIHTYIHIHTYVHIHTHTYRIMKANVAELNVRRQIRENNEWAWNNE